MLLFLYVYILNMRLIKYWRELILLCMVLVCIYMLYDPPQEEGFKLKRTLSDVRSYTKSALNKIQKTMQEVTSTKKESKSENTKEDKTTGNEKPKQGVCVPPNFEALQKSSSKSSKKKRLIK